MKTLFARLLLTAIFAGQVALLGAIQADARRMTCCVEAGKQMSPGHSHCPPMGGPVNSCCPDCPLLLTAVLPADAAHSPEVNRPQVAVFPNVALRANRRAEEPPVPPPRAA